LGLRDKLNENPKIAAGVIGGVIIVVLAIVFTTSGSGGGRAAPPSAEGTIAKKVFFSDDDGKTFFPDDATKVPPFDHGGKQAAYARVFRCGGKEFVNHLERYTADGKKRAEEIYTKGLYKTDGTALEVARQSGMEVKRPGGGAWVKVSDPKALEILAPQCPGGGSSDDLEAVYPPS
jgi:hypothetical protein